jgi:hypothetical protein
MSLTGLPVPVMVQKIFMVIVALVAIYMIVALLIGVPSIHLIGPVH